MPTAQQLKDAVDEADRLVARLANMEATIEAVKESLEIVVLGQSIVVKTRDRGSVQVIHEPLARTAAAAVVGAINVAIMETRANLHVVSATLRAPEGQPV